MSEKETRAELITAKYKLIEENKRLRRDMLILFVIWVLALVCSIALAVVE